MVVEFADDLRDLIFALVENDFAKVVLEDWEVVADDVEDDVGVDDGDDLVVVALGGVIAEFFLDYFKQLLLLHFNIKNCEIYG